MSGLEGSEGFGRKTHGEWHVCFWRQCCGGGIKDRVSQDETTFCLRVVIAHH